MNKRQRKKRMSKFFLRLPLDAFLCRDNIVNHIARLERELIKVMSVPNGMFAQNTENSVRETIRLLHFSNTEGQTRGGSRVV